MYEEIIPIEQQHELLAIRDNVSKDSWRIGDITLEVKAQHPEFGSGVIYSAIGAFVGKAQRTVREYAAISAFFSPKTREKYDMLAYDHFRTAMKYGGMWEGALEYAVRAVETLNRPATVDMMETMFEGGETRENYEKAEHTEKVMDFSKALTIAQRLLDVIRSIPEHSTSVEEDIEIVISDIEAEMEKEKLPL